VELRDHATPSIRPSFSSFRGNKPADLLHYLTEPSILCRRSISFAYTTPRIHNAVNRGTGVSTSGVIHLAGSQRSAYVAGTEERTLESGKDHRYHATKRYHGTSREAFPETDRSEIEVSPARLWFSLIHGLRASRRIRPSPTSDFAASPVALVLCGDTLPFGSLKTWYMSRLLIFGPTPTLRLRAPVHPLKGRSRKGRDGSPCRLPRAHVLPSS
jgi:hypothetical protein